LLTQSGGRVWQDRLEIDHDNLRAAFDWALEQGQTTTVLSLVAGLWRFWQARGHLHEARRRVDRALAMPGVMEQPAALRHRAFSAGGGVAYWQGDFVPANSWYQLALTAAEETGDRAEIALASYNFGFAALDRPTLSQDERYRAGRPWFERALALHRELGQEAGVADAEWGLALSAAASADLLGAHGHALRALEVYRRLDNAFGVGWAAHMLALYCLALERTEEAFTYAGEALSTFEGLRDLSGMVLVAYDVGLLLLSEGRREAGLRIAGAIDALREENGLGVIGDGFNHIAWKTPEQPIDPGELVLWREGATWSVEQVTAYARQYTPRTAPG
jgi:tetratricopeptide (TPR) repeat protein